jgi:hypothetical protein
MRSRAHFLDEVIGLTQGERTAAKIRGKNSMSTRSIIAPNRLQHYRFSDQGWVGRVLEKMQSVTVTITVNNGTHPGTFVDDTGLHIF